MTTPTKRKHHDLIVAYALGASIQSRNMKPLARQREWVDIPNPSWYDTIEYRVKPEREYPKTSLTRVELVEIHREAFHANSLNILEDVANSAIKRYIQDTEGK